MNPISGAEGDLLKVSIVHCSGIDLEHVRQVGPQIRERAGSITVPVASDLPSGWHIAIYHSDGEIQAFGIAQRGKRVSDLDARFNLLCSRRLSHPDNVSHYWSSLGSVLREGRQSGTLPALVVEAFLSLFARTNSAEAKDIGTYRAWIEGQSVYGEQARQLGLEKDVLLTLFDIANLDAGVLTRWSPEGLTSESTFLDGLSDETPSVVERSKDAPVGESGVADDDEFEMAASPAQRTRRSGRDITREENALEAVGINPFPRDRGQSILEDEIIVSDMFRMPGMSPSDSMVSRYIQWHRFQNKTASQVLHVMYANRGRVERDIGVDLVYYNETHRSYVCVQYKMMVQHRVNGWEYLPDRSLRKELRRMEKLDADSGDPKSWFDSRLYPHAGFLKLCQQEVIRPASTQMTEGMYITSSHTRALLRELDTRARGGGKTLNRGSVGRHLSNNLFVELVKAGHVGSVGRGFENVSGLLREAQEKGRRVVVAAHKQGR